MSQYNMAIRTGRSIQLMAAVAILSTAACSLIDSTRPEDNNAFRPVEIEFARPLDEPLTIGDTVTVNAIVRDARGNLVEDAEVWWSLSVDGQVLWEKTGPGPVRQTGPRSAVLTLAVYQATITATTIPDGDAESVTGTLQFTAPRRLWRAFVWSRESGFSLIPSPSRFDVTPVGINDRGEIVGNILSRDGTLQMAFVWSEPTGFEYLDPEGSAFSTATAINQAGVVTGRTRANGMRGAAFVWSRQSGMTIIPSDGYVQSTTINSLGEVAGSVDFRGFRWSPTVSTQLLAVGSDNPHSYVVAINDAGDVLGYDGLWEGWDPILSRQTPILWTAKGERLEIANCKRQCWMRVAALNNRGQIAGTLEQTAFRRSISGELTSIPITDHTVSIAMNDLGDVVGRAWRGTVGREWLWTASGEVIDIGLPPGARIVYVSGINNKGQVVGTFQ